MKYARLIFDLCAFFLIFVVPNACTFEANAPTAVVSPQTDAGTIVANAFKNTMALKTYRYEFKYSGFLMYADVDLQAAGEVNNQNRHEIVDLAPQDKTQKPEHSEFIIDDGKTYIHGPYSYQFPKAKWYLVPADNPLSQNSFGWSFALLFLKPPADGSNFAFVGQERLDQLACDIYALDKEGTLKTLAQDTRLLSAQELALIDSAEMRYWVCADDYLHRVQVDMVRHTAENPDKKTELSADIHLFDLNGNIQITAPNEVINLPTKTPPPEPYPMGIQSAQWSPDGNKIVAGSNNGMVYLWDAETGKKIAGLKATRQIDAVGFSPDGKRFFSSARDGVRIWNATSAAQIGILAVDSGYRRVAFSPDSKQILVSVRTTRVYDAGSLSEIFELKGSGAAYSPDGKRIITVDKEASHIWDATSGAELTTINGPFNDPTYNPIFSPDGARVLVGNVIFDAKTGNRVASSGKDAVRAIKSDYSSDGQRIVSGQSDNTALIWEAGTGQELMVLRGHTDWVGNVNFSPDDQQVLTLAYDHTARIWDAKTGRELATLNAPGSVVWDAAYRPDGKQILTSQIDGTLHIWDAATGRELRVLK